MPIFYFAIRFYDRQPFSFLNTAAVKKLGVYSYSIYLVHYVIIRFIAANFPGIESNPYLVFPITIVIAIAFAELVDRFVDRYFRKFRGQFRHGHVARPAVAVASE